MKKSLFIFAAACCLLLASCGEKSGTEGIGYAASEEYAAPASIQMNRASSKMVVTESAVFDDCAEYSDNEKSASEYAGERKLIKNGSVQIQADNFDTIEESIKAFVAGYNGYIVNTYSNEYYYNATIKIPSAMFDAAMENCGILGTVRSRSENSQDVTDEYYDLESRIETKKILQEKMESYLKQAKNISDLLEVERQLNEVISELEAYEGRMKRLSNQIDYSTITINIDLPTGYNDSGYVWPDLKENFRELGVNIVNFFAGLLMFLVYLVIYGIPVIAIGALLFWLLFGKVGLLVKLYKIIKNK